MVEVAFFLGEGRAGAGNRQGYPIGEKHVLMLFLRQERGTEPDFEAATREMEKRGWQEIVLFRAAYAIKNAVGYREEWTILRPKYLTIFPL
jgi:hypothetical protein